MTSKECLERLLKIAYVEPGPTKEKFITYAREIEHNKKCSDLYNTIKQDLDRLEELEKENQVLREKVNHFKNVKNRYRRNEKFVEKENAKLKNAIDIFKRKMIIVKLRDNEYIIHGNEYITKEQYELLKEVL